MRWGDFKISLNCLLSLSLFLYRFKAGFLAKNKPFRPELPFCLRIHTGLINFIDPKAKCRLLKKYLIWDFAAGFWGSLPMPPPYTLYTCILYTYSQGRGEGRANQREGWRRDSSQNWVENTNKTHCITSLQILINTCHKVPLQVFFRWRHLALVPI